MEANTLTFDLSRVLAHRWRPAPHRPDPGRGLSNARRLRTDDANRTADHRRDNDDCDILRSPALESGLLPPRTGPTRWQLRQQPARVHTERTDSTTLQDLQAPLKQRYRSDPTAAQTALSAHGDYRDPGVTCT